MTACLHPARGSLEAPGASDWRNLCTTRLITAKTLFLFYFILFYFRSSIAANRSGTKTTFTTTKSGGVGGLIRSRVQLTSPGSNPGLIASPCTKPLCAHLWIDRCVCLTPSGGNRVTRMNTGTALDVHTCNMTE